MTKAEESKIIVGLDVGSSKVVAVIGEVLPDGVINVMGAGISPSKGVEKGAVIDLDAAVKAINRAVEEAEYVVDGCRVVGVTLSISGEISSHNEQGQVVLSGTVRQEDIDNAIHIAHSVKLPEGLEILHIIPQEYRLDRFPAIKNPIALAGNRLTAQVNLIACHNAWLANLKKAVEQNKYKIDQVVFSGLASSYSVLTQDEKELGVCLIDFGSSTMDILVYTNGALRFSKVISYGGNDITNYIAERFAISRQQAENMKIQYGSAIFPPLHSADHRITVDGLGNKPTRVITRTQLSEVTAVCYSDMFRVVKETLDSLRVELQRQGIPDELIAGIVLTGGSSQIEDVVECARSVFKSEVRVGTPLNITGLTDYVNKPQYATALGLLQYSHYNDVDSSLFSGNSGVKEMFSTFIDKANKVRNWFRKSF